MTLAGLRRAALLAIPIALLGVVVFLVPSAYAIEHHAPRWLAWTIGGLGFPLLPLAWHLVAERRHRRAAAAVAAAASAKPKGARPAKPDRLTAVDRWFLRGVAVGVVAIAPLALISGRGVVGAVHRHWRWPLGVRVALEVPVPARSDPRMVDAVPDDAELVVWLRDRDAFSRSLRGSIDPDERGDSLFAYRPGRLEMVIRDEPATLARYDGDAAFVELSQDVLGRADHPVIAHPAADLLVLSSPGWDAVAARIGGRAPRASAMADALASAPLASPLLAAARPRGPLFGLSFAAAWASLRIGGGAVVVEAEASTVDGTAATALVAALRGLLAHPLGPAACGAEIEAAGRGVFVGVIERRVWLRAAVSPRHLMLGLACLANHGVTAP